MYLFGVFTDLEGGRINNKNFAGKSTTIRILMPERMKVLHFVVYDLFTKREFLCCNSVILAQTIFAQAKLLFYD